MQLRISTAGLLAIVLWGATMTVQFGHANPPSSSYRPVDETLTNDSLKAMLDGMGYEPKPLSKGYLLALKNGTWTVNMQVVLSGDLRKIGLNANLGKVENPDAVTATQWRDLLISNGDIDPSSFYFDAQQKKLYLHRSFDNRAVSAASMRREIENFSGNVVSTGKLWDFAK